MINQQLQSSYTQLQTMNKSFQFTDEELIFRFQNGDEQSYIELVKRYKDRLINFVFRLVNDRDQAEDIIQDTMLKLYTHKHYYKNIAKFSMYLSLILSFLVFTNIYESNSNFFNLVGNNLLNNVIIFLYLSAGILSFGSFKSLQEKSYTGVMASTGLSYLSLIVSLGASGTLILSI